MTHHEWQPLESVKWQVTGIVADVVRSFFLSHSQPGCTPRKEKTPTAKVVLKLSVAGVIPGISPTKLFTRIKKEDRCENSGNKFLCLCSPSTISVIMAINSIRSFEDSFEQKSDRMGQPQLLQSPRAKRVR